jgi:tetratricopeptide (TPR) repeat protein
MDRPTTSRESATPPLSSPEQAAQPGRGGSVAASRASDAIGPTKPARRPARHRGLGGTVVLSVLLVGLAWLTYENATRSRALGEALNAEVRGDYPAALRAAIEHLDRRPWSFEASRVAARCLSRLDFAEEAEPYYRRAWGATVDDLRYRAYGLTRANLRERALEAFNDVLRRDPEDIASLRLKAGLLLSMTRWNDVAAIGRQLLASSRRSAEANAPVAVADHWTLRPMTVPSVRALGASLVAIAFHNQEDVEEAVAAYEMVLELDPELRSMPLDRRLFWTQFGEDLLSLGRANDVVRLLTSEDPIRSDPVLVALLARAHTQEGLTDQAESAWRRVLELSPDVAAAWLNLGRIELGRGHPEEAARLLVRAAARSPDSVDAAYNLGLTYRRLGQSDLAKKWEQEAARLRTRRDEKARGATSGPADVPKTSSGADRPAASAS